ncbi:MAG: hypothetical protein ACOZNI_12390 [Myxococcota bacterium]
MRSVPDWPALLQTVWDDVAERWSERVEGGRVCVAVEVLHGDATPGRWEAVADPGGPGQGEPALRAALACLLPRAGYPFEGTITILAGEQELARRRVRESRAKVPASVRAADARALTQARKADAEKTRQMLEMHRNAPEVVVVGAALPKEARRMNLAPPHVPAKRDAAPEDALVEMARAVMERVVHGHPGTAPPAQKAPAPEGSKRLFDAWAVALDSGEDGTE